MPRVVVDTNVFVSVLLGPAGASRGPAGASRGPAGASRGVLRLALTGAIEPLMGNALFSEYEDVVSREKLLDDAGLTRHEAETLLDAFMSVCVWTPVYYLWRPNLPDEADNHVLELALAGGAETIITANKRDFEGGELNFPGIRIMAPGEFMKEWNTR